jgi:hypothetical protein
MTKIQEGHEYPYRIRRGKAKWTRHILRRNCRLKHVIEGNIKEAERRERRRKQLPGDLKRKRRYWKLKEKALYRALWGTRLERGYGPFVRHALGSLGMSDKQLNHL